MDTVAEIALEDYLLNNRDDEHKPIINIFSTRHALPILGTEVKDLIEVKQNENYRSELNARSDARICLGGQLKNEKNEMPGVLHEAWIAANAGQLVLVSHCLGGISAWMAEGLLAIDKAQLPTHYPDPSSLGMPHDPMDILRVIDNNVPQDLRSIYRRLLQSTHFEATHFIILEILEQWNSVRRETGKHYSEHALTEEQRAMPEP